MAVLAIALGSVGFMNLPGSWLGVGLIAFAVLLFYGETMAPGFGLFGYGSESGARAGASKVTQDISATIAELPVHVESLTGIELISTLKNLPVIVSHETINGDETSSEGDAAADQ